MSECVGHCAVWFNIVHEVVSCGSTCVCLCFALACVFVFVCICADLTWHDLVIFLDFIDWTRLVCFVVVCVWYFFCLCSLPVFCGRFDVDVWVLFRFSLVKLALAEIDNVLFASAVVFCLHVWWCYALTYMWNKVFYACFFAFFVIARNTRMRSDVTYEEVGVCRLSAAQNGFCMMYGVWWYLTS